MAIEYRTEPEYCEWLDGKAHPKVSPRHVHAILESQLSHLLIMCGARTLGTVGSEQDAMIGKRDGTKSKLIPDVSFSLFEQFKGLNKQDIDEPPFSPAIAIEIWSRGDSRAYLDQKIERFLKTGSQLVLDVHPKNRTVAAFTASGTTTFGAGERFTNDVFPWFTFDVNELFSVIDVLPDFLREL